MKHVPETKRLTFTGAAGADSVYPEDQLSHEEIWGQTGSDELVKLQFGFVKIKRVGFSKFRNWLVWIRCLKKVVGYKLPHVLVNSQSQIIWVQLISPGT